MSIAEQIRRFRSLPVAIFGIALLIVLGGIGVVAQNEGAYSRAQVAQTQALAEVLAASVTAAVDFQDYAAAQEAVDAFRVNRQVQWIGVYNQQGRPVSGFARGPDTVPADLNAAASASQRTGTITASITLKAAGQPIGTIIFAAEREPAAQRISRYLLLGGLVMLAALVVIGLGVTQTQLRGANRDLAARAEALAKANALLEDEMTQRARAEEQLRQSQKMQVLGQLTGGIAHDFNNLLTVILGSADMLTRDRVTDEKRIRFSKAIVQAAGNASALTSQLLAFARRQPLKPEKIDLNELVSSLHDLLDRTLGEQVTVRTRLCADGCPIEADKAQLQSAILNVASNARDAMKDGGQLTIATEHRIGEDERKMVALMLTDSGSGMDRETQERVFEPFFTTKATGKGTGLGLSQVYGFASQSGGEVQIRSAPGEGTTLTILLPCAATMLAKSTPERGVEATLPSSRILVVEDNEEVGAFAEGLLTELGHRVARALSAEEALQLIASEPFDLVFSDVVMPGMGGLRLAEILRRDRPSLPVVLATGYSPEIAESGIGGQRIILKPYSVASLSEALAEALMEAR